ncbi:MAG TPA: ABC transporter permease [Terracidiphilus sp.]|nr:ABC transporter permease [Terracidiphilus sp.]
MNPIAWLRSLATRLFRGSSAARDIDEELRSHIAHRADDLVSGGMDRARAERHARIEFGGIEHYREESHTALGGDSILTLLSDVRYSLRKLRKSPGFTFAAIFTLALAIGANALVFGVVNSVVLRPVDVRNAQSLYCIDHVNDQWQSYPNYIELRDRNHSFENLAAMALSEVSFDTGKDPSRIWGFAVTGNYFDTLNVQPMLGRLFHASDERGPNSAPYIVLSYNYWHIHFQDDRNVIGRVVRINRQPYTVIGVAPREFNGTFIFFAPNFYIPLVNDESSRMSQRDNRYIIQVLGHLKPGVSRAQALADLNQIGDSLKKAYPADDLNESFTLGRPSVPSVLGRPLRAFVVALMLLAALILIAACANLGSLFAARTADRSREVALRLSLGSSRILILRQLLTEAVLISLAGGAVGLAGSVPLLNRLNLWQPFSGVPIHVPVRPDANLYLVALLLAVVSGILFGIVPIRQVLRTDPYEVVKAGTSARAGRLSLRDALVVVQIAICAVLVTSSMVAVRGLMRSMHSNFGIDPQNVMLVETDLKEAGYPLAEVEPMQRRMIDALTSIPGVEHVGLVSFAPLGRGGSWQANVFRDSARNFTAPKAAANAYMYVISPDYLRAAGTALIAGRQFTLNDDSKSPSVAIVNREFAATVLGSVSGAVGRFYRSQDGTRIQVVGVVEDGKYLTITEDQKPAFFVPALQQAPLAEQWYLVRSNRDQQQLASAIRARVRALDSTLPIDMLPWTRELDFSMFPSRMAALSLGVLGSMGAILSITGIFGMAAYSVSRRLKELGIRVALGAKRIEVLHSALGRALKLLAVGSAAGLLLGLMATRVLAFIVYQATPRDPLVLSGAVLAMALLGLLATWIPAQRALSVNPVVLLREE